MNRDAPVLMQRAQVEVKRDVALRPETPRPHRRVIETYRWRDEVVVATFHQPLDVAVRSRVALVLVNAGPAPRAGNSDLSRQIAEHVAREGFSVFRLDFPGVGDSTGESFKRIEDFRLAAQESSLDDVLAEVVEQICARHEVDRVVIGGLCAGAVVSLRAARRMGRRCAGVVLLEPDFLDARVTTQTTWRNPRAFTERVLRGLARRRGSASVARTAQRIYEWLERGRMPEAIARDVVDAWINLTDSRVPTFLAVVEGMHCDTLCARIAGAAEMEIGRMMIGELESEDSSNFSLVTCFALRNTNHLFTAGEAPEALPLAIGAWIQRFSTRASDASRHAFSALPARSQPRARGL